MLHDRLEKFMQLSSGHCFGLMFVLPLAALFTLNSCAGFWIKPYGTIASDNAAIRADGKPVFLPGNAPSISQGYNPAPDDEFTTEHVHNHTGIDIVAEKGTPVIAPAAGVVTGSYFELMYGNRVEMDLGRNENGRFVKAQFLHLKKRLVQKGDTVSRGQQLGTLGATGLLAAGIPHLHYEIQVGDRPEALEPINPHWLWADGVGIVTCFDRSKSWPERPLKTTYPLPCRDVDWQ